MGWGRNPRCPNAGSIGHGGDCPAFAPSVREHKIKCKSIRVTCNAHRVQKFRHQDDPGLIHAPQNVRAVAVTSEGYKDLVGWLAVDLDDFRAGQAGTLRRLSYNQPIIKPEQSKR